MYRAIVYNGWIDNLVFVNMNARMYDPQNGRLLAPDPMIQTPDNPQNFNRYTYCLNNPLRYTDPTGMFATEEEARNYGDKYGGAEVGYSHLRGEWYKTLKSTLNIGVSIIGSITGPIGAIVSSVYFIGDVLTNGYGTNDE